MGGTEKACEMLLDVQNSYKQVIYVDIQKQNFLNLPNFQPQHSSCEVTAVALHMISFFLSLILLFGQPCNQRNKGDHTYITT